MKIKKPPEKKQTIEHYNAILLEDIKSKMDVVIDGMEGTKDSIKKDVRHLEQKLTGEVELLKGVLHKHSGEINMVLTSQSNSNNRIKEAALQVVENNRRVEALHGRVEALQGQVSQLERNLSDKIDSIHTSINEHEAKPVNIAHPAPLIE